MEAHSGRQLLEIVSLYSISFTYSPTPRRKSPHLPAYIPYFSAYTYVDARFSRHWRNWWRSSPWKAILRSWLYHQSGGTFLVSSYKPSWILWTFAHCRKTSRSSLRRLRLSLKVPQTRTNWSSTVSSSRQLLVPWILVITLPPFSFRIVYDRSISLLHAHGIDLTSACSLLIGTASFELSWNISHMRSHVDPAHTSSSSATISSCLFIYYLLASLCINCCATLHAEASHCRLALLKTQRGSVTPSSYSENDA